MTKFLSILFIVLFLASCSKSEVANTDPLPDPMEDGTVQYIINGDSVVIHNDSTRIRSVFWKVPDSSTTIPTMKYYFNSNWAASNQWVAIIVADSLKVQSYILDSANTITTGTRYNNQISFVHYDGDNMIFNITKHSGGLASGTFSAKLSPQDPNFPYSLKGSVIITEGKFKNIPVNY